VYAESAAALLVDDLVPFIGVGVSWWQVGAAAPAVCRIIALRFRTDQAGAAFETDRRQASGSPLRASTT
jgi:hypothetical protein